jgi:pilus assembly protein CpaC
MMALKEQVVSNWRRSAGAAVALVLALGAAPVSAQQATLTPTPIDVPRGASIVVEHPTTMERVLITDPAVADAVPVSGTEVVLNGNNAGTTTLLIWGLDGSRAAYTVRVALNAEALAAELDRLLPSSGIQVTDAGNALILSGEGIHPRVAQRALGLAESLSEGVTVIDHISVPDQAQVLLRVRLAEVNRSAVQNLGSRFSVVDPDNLRSGTEVAFGVGGYSGAFLGGGGPDVTFSDAINFFLFHDPSNVGAFIRALRDEGSFRSLAEPNLLAYPGEEASFLAGGEFPYPSIQGQAGGVSVEFREFGVRLNFTPTITNSGAIRLEVAPEVSSLDFGAGLQLQGFTIPALLTRRAETIVELQEGQTFAIAGLVDSQLQRSVQKIPLLGDIPILGALFQTRESRDSQTELLVLVTPQLVYASDMAPDVPTGELSEWDWDRYLRPFNVPASTNMTTIPPDSTDLGSMR